MDYKISNICSDLGIGKSTIYKRIEFLKKDIPETDWKNNSFFYYDNGKLFITQKGYNFIKNFKQKSDNIRHNSTNDISIYQNQIIDIYKKRIEYLENENKRLLDIISLKEQKEIAKDIHFIDDNSKNKFSLFDKLFHRFKKAD